MKYLILILIPFLSFTQQDVPDKYWVEDNEFENAINTNEAFGDDQNKPVVLRSSVTLVSSPICGAPAILF